MFYQQYAMQQAQQAQGPHRAIKHTKQPKLTKTYRDVKRDIVYHTFMGPGHYQQQGYGQQQGQEPGYGGQGPGYGGHEYGKDTTTFTTTIAWST